MSNCNFACLGSCNFTIEHHRFQLIDNNLSISYLKRFLELSNFKWISSFMRKIRCEARWRTCRRTFTINICRSLRTHSRWQARFSSWKFTLLPARARCYCRLTTFTGLFSYCTRAPGRPRARLAANLFSFRPLYTNESSTVFFFFGHRRPATLRTRALALKIRRQCFFLSLCPAQIVFTLFIASLGGRESCVKKISFISRDFFLWLSKKVKKKKLVIFAW